MRDLMTAVLTRLKYFATYGVKRPVWPLVAGSAERTLWGDKNMRRFFLLHALLKWPWPLAVRMMTWPVIVTSASCWRLSTGIRLA